MGVDLFSLDIGAVYRKEDAKIEHRVHGGFTEEGH
jgi:hypothetical protein